ncbi:MAG: hypothetical protein A2W91_16910 [Bacteroidetes bacterium GWF2_38_335]|nr:MAG: hypothetical protein A2W91_16910 [Bacteroidetes bacterium GWF2_38_335]OFY81365.1 MAG: hypothetical protein A2281_07885 [Bacteroidetes bacterium RIFOXYA12_FULL_38_20]HBS85488.1 hypothetical protein [Bacteroidales bacterium]
MKAILLILLIFAAISVFSQNTGNIDTRLYAKYSSEYLEKLRAEHPEKLDYLNFCVHNQCYVVDMPGKPVPAIELTKTEDPGYQITASDLLNFNMLEYNIFSSVNDQKYYKAGNSGKMIIVRSEKMMRQLYDNSKRIK